MEQAPRRRGGLRLDPLEDRLAPATLTVNTLNDAMLGSQLSLRDAVNAIQAGTYMGSAMGQISGTFGVNDTIIFQAGLNGTLSINAANGPFILGKDVTLFANPSLNAITINGQNTSAIFKVNATVEASVAGLTLHQGKDLANQYGAISVLAGGELTVNNCTFTANVSGGANGGGAILNAGTLTVTNSTFTTNSGLTGGAINNLAGATATVINSTLSANQATTASGMGGGIANAGSLTILNTIVAQNKSAGTAPDVSGSFSSAGHNLIGNRTGSTGFTDGSNGDQVGSVAPFLGNLTSGLNTIESVSSTAGLQVGQLVTDSAGALPAGTVIKLIGPNTITLSQVASSTQTGITFISAVNARLGPLQNNGGGLQTMAPLPLSPAIDGGANSDPLLTVATTDQRGISRPQAGNVDIGAFEANQILVTNLDDAGSGSLREALAQSNSTPGTVVIDFQPGLTGDISLTTGRLEVVHDNWIRGPGADVITVDGNNNFWCFGVNSQYTVGSPGLYVAIDGLTMTRGRQISGLSDSRGGAISYRNSFPFPSHLTVTNSVINNSTNGGIYAEDRLSIHNTRVENNSGHGLNINGDFLDVSDSWFKGNSSRGISADVHAVVVNSTISGNGGTTTNGIRNGNGNQLLTNCTVTGNAMGVEVSLDDIGRYINCTIINNTNEDARSVVGNGAGRMYFANSIVGKLVAQFGSFTSQNNNIFMNGFPTTLQINDVVAPGITTLTGSSGGTLAGGQYYYMVSAVTASGMLPSREMSVVVSSNQKVTVNWTAPQNAATVNDYKIYRGVISGELTLIATVNSALSYIDTGTVGTEAGLGLLLPLDDNDGPTPTMALTSTGREYAAGKSNVSLSPLFDQRGVLRNPLYPDIGAFQSTTSSPNTITITPTTLPGVGVGLSYAQTITATGGTGSGYLYGVTDGTLPPGVSLGLDGELSGTATTAGSYTFTVTCFDDNGNHGLQQYTVSVNPPPAIVTTSLPGAAVGVAYDAAVQTTGGTAPFTWSVTGTLPNGVTFNTSTGTFGGTPEVGSAGTYSNIEVTVADFYGATATQTYSIAVQWAISLNPTLPPVTVDTPYNHSQTIGGGTGPYSNLNVTGLPNGLTASILGTTLTVIGTPTATGTFPLSITLHDDGTNTTSTAASASIVVNPTVAITTLALPEWTETLAYSQTIATTGGTGAKTFAVATGTLPAGLNLNSTTGVIDGTPETGSAGDYPITIEVTDASGAVASQAYTLTINAVTLGSLTFKQWSINRAGFIGTIAASTGTGTPSLQLTSGLLPIGLTPTLSNGVISFTGTPAVAGTYTFTLQLTDSLGVFTNQTYTVDVNPSTTAVWTGLGADNNLLTPGNWAGGVAPIAGNTLLFGGGPAVSQTTANNNFPANTSFTALHFVEGGYTVTGNAVKLTAGVSSSSTTGGISTVALNIAMPKVQTFNIVGTTVINMTGVLSGKKSALSKFGGGTLALSSPTGNTYTGLTTVNTGTLQLLGHQQITDLGTVVVNGTGELDLNNFNETIANLTLVGGTVETGTGTLSVSKAVKTTASSTTAHLNGQLHLTSLKPTITVNDGLATTDLVLDASITAVSLNKTGKGTMALTGNNAGYAGLTKISAGTLNLDDPTALGTGTLLANKGTTITMDGDGLAFNTPLTLSTKATLKNPTGTNTWAGPITNAGTGIVDVASGTVTLNGPIGGNGGLTKNGVGTLVLPNANTYKGTTTVNAGMLKVPNTASLTNTAAVAVAAAGTFFMDGTGLNFNRTLTLRGTLDSTSGSNTWSGRIKTLATTSEVNVGTGHTLTLSGVISGGGGLMINDGTAGTVLLTNANGYSGTTTINAGIVGIQNGKALGSPSGATTVASGATLQLSGDLKVAEKLTLNGVGAAGTTGALQHLSGTSAWTSTLTLASNSTVAVDAGTLTLGGKIGGTGSLTQVGSGKLTLAALTTATGGTIVTAGTFSGGGTVGALQLNAGSTLAPGALVTQILKTGNVTFATGSTFAVRVNGVKAGSGYDQLSVTGAVHLADATLDVSLGFTPLLGSTYTLIQNDSLDAIVGTFAGLAEGATLTLGGMTFTISYVGGTGNDVVLTRTA